MGQIGKFYRLDEPEIGEVNAAFRTLPDLQDFVRHAGVIKGNVVPVYAVTGKVMEDEGTPDGLFVLVESYRELFTPEGDESVR